jgi:hypothetical protein
MKLETAFDLCDAIVAAILVAQPTWLVSTEVDPQKDASKLPLDIVELMIGPIAVEEVMDKDSRKIIAGEVTLAMRLRSKIGTQNALTKVRAKAVQWDAAVAILQRAQGYNLGAAGHFHWNAGMAALITDSLRKDHVVSIGSVDISFMAPRRNPKWEA